MYHTILFDLDGTLTDPGEGITNSVAYALEKWNIYVENRTELYPFIGPPLKDSFMDFYSFSEEQAEQAVACYREYFQDRGIFENVVYEGVEEMLKTLKASGRKVILATSKPEEFAVRILEHFHLAAYFDFIGGASMDGTRVKKADVISYALKESKVTDLSGAVMIGDRKHDILGAAQAGLDSIGVLYGYGDEAELREAGALYLAERVEDIAGLVCREE